MLCPAPAGGTAGPARPAGPLVLLGPTASGKTAVSLEVARRLPGAEIVVVDSMQVYRGMDIGTAKPTSAERAAVPHHLVDLVEPHEEFTVSDFQDAARAALVGIAARGGIAVVVAGTGLYLRALLDGLDLPGRYPGVRAGLDAEPDTVALHRRLAALDPLAATRMEPTNRRRVVRALEVCIGSGRRFSSFGPGLATYPEVAFHQVGLSWDRAVLDRRIEARYRHQLAAGFLEEVRALHGGAEPLSRTARQALGYKELLDHVAGDMPFDEALDLALRRTRRFARRQERWFRRDPRAHWVPGGDNPVEVAERVLRDWRGCD
ncbi:MAG: tRNA (adenosine(37)-N6)-dimethylallyltransferase MiaA [Acidimicrobiia bacterium]|nr:tRNA (adenosine(37)-N6)-dimethylallyltransferase MiaA [Acidimicrobiia bacterium]